MSKPSSSVAGWFTHLETVGPAASASRPDDRRLADITETWKGDEDALRPGRAVIVGFPQDEGVRRNQGRPGAAEAPQTVRTWLSRLPAGDAQQDIDLAAQPPLDAGNVRIQGSLEETQEILGEVIHGILAREAVPVILGGGHETAYGHYLGYVRGRRRVAIINIDAHLDVRSSPVNQGHSGSPFRQAMDHPQHPLPPSRYVCLGVQPHAVSREHLRLVRERGCVIRWANELQPSLATHLEPEIHRLATENCQIYLSVDADVVRAADVPGVSAPNPLGLSAEEVALACRTAGQALQVTSFDLVEINPRQDRDDQSSRWAAVAVWHFLVGLALRGGHGLSPRVSSRSKNAHHE